MNRIDPGEAIDHLPQPLVIVTAGDPEKPMKRGGMTAAWVSRVSWDPPLVMVAMAPSRFTLELIKEFGAFVINIVGKSLERQAYGIFGSTTGRNMDKFEASKVSFFKAGSVTAPVLADATVALECKLEKIVEVGDHMLVIGRVVDAWKLREEKPLIFYRVSSAELK